MLRAIFIISLIALACGVLVFGATTVWQVFKKPFVAEKPAENTDSALPPLTLPAGMLANVYATNVPGARDLMFGPDGTLWASQTKEGKVVSLPDRNHDGEADERKTIIEGLKEPHGLALDCVITGFVTEGTSSIPTEACRVFIAETHRVVRYDYNKNTQALENPFTLAELPGGGGHSTRSLFILPTEAGKLLLISVGSSCNVCNEDDVRRAKVLSVPLEGGELQSFASGLRNSVFLSQHPETRQLWATEMGRDRLGDDTPPDEINILRWGADYGWPRCYGNNIADTDFLGPTAIETEAEDASTTRSQITISEKSLCADKTASHIDIQAHSAPLGLTFVPKESTWPEEYKGDVLVAYHGSWNRSTPTGYKIVRFEQDTATQKYIQNDFISGWLTPNNVVLGRPVDLVFASTSDLFISDDHSGLIYRVRHVK